MNRVRKWIITLTLILCTFSQSITVFAGAEWDGLAEREQENARNLYAYLKFAGYSDYAAAGICGNADQESSFQDTYNSGDRNYYGYFQTNENTYHVWTALKSWASDNGLDYNDIVVQFKYVETGLESDFSTYATISLSDYKACTDIVTGVEGFMVAHERCVGGEYAPVKVKSKKNASSKYQDGDVRIQYAESCYTALVGTAPADGGGSNSSDTSSDGTQSQESVKQQLLATGYYTEEQLSAYIKLTETNIDEKYLVNAKRESLGQQDLENLSSWEDNVKNSKKEYGLIAWMRIIVMWIGIIFTIYIFLLYLAYWFDKLNSIVDLDVLSIMTFGRLHVAMDDKEANFSLAKKQDRMTVNHKDMVFICLTGLIFGTLLITGTFYKIVANFVNTILRWIG